MNEPVVDQRRIEANWRAITAELDAPRPALIERILRRAQIPGHVVRMIVATPALRRAWYLSIIAVALVGLGAADPARRDTLFTLLVLAPMLPVLGVGMAYGTAADPSHEIQLATPTHEPGLVAIRTATVLVVTIGIIGALSAMNTAARPMAAAWLLPAVAVTTASLAVMTYLPPRRATAAVAAAWFAAVLIARIVADDPLAAFAAVGQLVAIVVAVGAAAVVVIRRASFEQLGRAA